MKDSNKKEQQFTDEEMRDQDARTAVEWSLNPDRYHGISLQAVKDLLRAAGGVLANGAYAAGANLEDFAHILKSIPADTHEGAIVRLMLRGMPNATTDREVVFVAIHYIDEHDFIPEISGVFKTRECAIRTVSRIAIQAAIEEERENAPEKPTSVFGIRMDEKKTRLSLTRDGRDEGEYAWWEIDEEILSD